MANSKANGNDYSECEFKSLWDGPKPSGIANMIEKALRSFAPDKKAINERWGPEGKLYAHTPTDICCADAVGWTLHQTGVVDHVAAPGHKIFDNGGGVHWAPYWMPNAKNESIARVIKRSHVLSDFYKDAGKRVLAYDDWLPGDYLLFSGTKKVRNHDAGEPHHINIYVGPFCEVNNGELISPDDPYGILNGSLGLGGNNGFVLPRKLYNIIQYYCARGEDIWHCRMLAVERLYQENIGLPVKLAAPPEVTTKTKKITAANVSDDPNAPPPLDAPLEMGWWLANRTDAPYPLGRLLTWHQGVHIPTGTGVEGGDVWAFAPGELVRARFGPRVEEVDTSYLLLRHRLDPVRKAVIAPPKDNDPPPASGAATPVYFYSLYMHLGRLEGLLQPNAQGQVDAHSVPIPEAPVWLHSLAARAVPAPREFIPSNAVVTLFAWSSDTDHVPLQLARPLPPDREFDLPELETLPIRGADYYLLKHRPEATNRDKWTHLPYSPTVPKNAKLHYFNPYTGEYIDTKLAVPTDTLLALDATRVRMVGSTSTGTPMAAILAFDEPAIDVTREPRFDERAESDATVMVYDDAEKTLEMLTVTDGEEEQRKLSKPVKIANKDYRLEFEQLERSIAGGRSQTEYAWVKLIPCVALSEAEKTAIETRLEDENSGYIAHALERLAQSRSALAGVDIGPKYGWQLVDNVLRPTAAILAETKPEKKVLTVYRVVEGAGKKRVFKAGPDLSDPQATGSDGDANIVVGLVPTEDLAIRPVEVFESGGRKHALFELLIVAEPSQKTDNSQEIEKIKAHNRTTESVMSKLLRGDAVDLLTEQGVTTEQRRIAREPIARAGSLPTASASQQAFHFEIFSGENLVDKNATGEDGVVSAVPRSRWLVLRDGATSSLFTRDAVKRLLKSLADFGEAHLVDTEPLTKALETGVPTPDEWLAFARKNQRTLSRLITVHASEWSVDWGAESTGDATRGAHVPASDREQQANVLRELRWWLSDLALEGVSGPPFFYHPLRFIEWMRTGVDVSIAGAGDDAKVKIRIEGRGEDVELGRDAQRNAFTFRTFLGDVMSEVPATLILEGVPTATREVPIKMVRGEVIRISLTVPKLSLADIRGEGGISYVIPIKAVSTGDDKVHYLLADGGDILPTIGYSNASFSVDVAYNVKLPSTVSLAIEGDGFVINEWELSGASPANAKDPTSGGPTRSLSLSLKPTQPVQHVRSSMSYSIRADVAVTANTRPDQSAKLVVKVSGGDFPAEKSASEAVATRTIKPKIPELKKTPSAEDVAKLQLYLSQILAEDELPCYRYNGKNRDYDGGKSNNPIIVDGRYSPSLARALWRFMYSFAEQTAWTAGPIEVVDENNAHVESVTLAQLRQVPKDMLRAAAMPASGTPEYDQFFYRVHAEDTTGKGKTKQNYNRYPVVDAALLAEVKRRFRPPYVLPMVVFDPQATTVEPYTGLKIKDSWNKTPAGQTTILAGGDTVKLTVKCPGIQDTGGDVQVVLALPAGSAYRISVAGAAGVASTQQSLARLASGLDIALVPTGATDTKPEDNVLTVHTADGAKLGSLQLAGARDLLSAKKGGACRDAALVQSWLARMPNPDRTGEMLLKPSGSSGKGANKTYTYTIDGVWSAACADALKAYQRLYAPSTTGLPDVIVTLKGLAALRPPATPAPVAATAH